MKSEELEEVTRIENESFNQPWSRVAFAYELKSRTFHPLVVKIDSKVIAYSVAWFVADEVHLGNITTDNNYRRMGLTHRLLARTITIPSTELRVEQKLKSYERSAIPLVQFPIRYIIQIESCGIAEQITLLLTFKGNNGINYETQNLFEMAKSPI